PSQGDLPRGRARMDGGGGGPRQDQLRAPGLEAGRLDRAAADVQPNGAPAPQECPIHRTVNGLPVLPGRGEPQSRTRITSEETTIATGRQSEKKASNRPPRRKECR